MGVGMFMKEKLARADTKMKGINSNFDRFDQNFAKFELRMEDINKNLTEFQLKVDKEKSKKVNNDVINEIKGKFKLFKIITEEFEKLKSFTSFKADDNKSKIDSLQEFLIHYTPLQTHIQVCEAFEYLDCLSSENKLSLFKIHKARMLKIQ